MNEEQNGAERTKARLSEAGGEGEAGLWCSLSLSWSTCSSPSVWMEQDWSGKNKEKAEVEASGGGAVGSSGVVVLSLSWSRWMRREASVRGLPAGYTQRIIFECKRMEGAMLTVCTSYVVAIIFLLYN